MRGTAPARRPVGGTITGGKKMFTEKQKVLQDAPNVLNKPDRPWHVTVEGDRIIARWKWMDATFFSPGSVTDATRLYTFTVTLKDGGKWRELDRTDDTTVGVSLTKISAGKEVFIGWKNQKTITAGFGKNKSTGETGIIKSRFNTSSVKVPVRDYLKSCGWKKERLFGW
jgi:hypothetical protein